MPGGPKSACTRRMETRTPPLYDEKLRSQLVADNDASQGGVLDVPLRMVPPTGDAVLSVPVAALHRALASPAQWAE